jgi:hypothetical protein
MSSAVSFGPRLWAGSGRFIRQGFPIKMYTASPTLFGISWPRKAMPTRVASPYLLTGLCRVMHRSVIRTRVHRISPLPSNQSQWQHQHNVWVKDTFGAHYVGQCQPLTIFMPICCLILALNWMSSFIHGLAHGRGILDIANRMLRPWPYVPPLLLTATRDKHYVSIHPCPPWQVRVTSVRAM